MKRRITDHDRALAAARRCVPKIADQDKYRAAFDYFVCGYVHALYNAKERARYAAKRTAQ